MAIRQLSVYVENDSGSLVRVTQLLADNGIDLRSICVADTANYGIVRFLTDDTGKAAEVLKDAGYAAKLRDVVVTAVPNEKGGLNRVLKLLSGNGIDLEYMYSVISSAEGEAWMVMRVDDNEKTEKLLKDNHVRVLSEDDI